MRRKPDGFTLIELLVVIAIIGILAAIIAPNAFNAIEKARIAEAISDLKAIKTAALSYYSDVGFFPPDVWAGVDPGFMQPLPNTTNTSWIYWGNAGLTEAQAVPVIEEKWDGPYLEKWKVYHPWRKYTTAQDDTRGGKYDYENWTNHTPPASWGDAQNIKIGVTMFGVPDSAYNRIQDMYDAGKFPFELAFGHSDNGYNTITAELVAKTE